MKQVEGASALLINKPSSNHQLLVTLCRNGDHWLSPVGWTEAEKGTLLDCQTKGDMTEIQIPTEFSRQILTGDTLELRCAELGLDEKLTWNAAYMPGEATAPAKKKGLFGRFGRSDEAIDLAPKAVTTEMRAEEAEKAAQTYREKMEAAEAARAEARLKAEEAAKMAEDAQRAEEERVAEMERAAKAYEEAERLRQDELRRLEEERLAEEARIAEEKRLAEEKRKREEAARLAAERQAAKDRIREDIKTKTEARRALADQLKTYSDDVETLESDLSIDQRKYIELEDRVDDINVKALKQGESYDSNRAKLESLETDLNSVKETEAQKLKARDKLTKQIGQAENIFADALAKAKAAQKFADEKRAELDALKSDDKKAAVELDDLVAKQTKTHEAMSAKRETVKSLQDKYEATKRVLSDKTTEMHALSESVTQRKQKLNDVKNDIRETEEKLKLVEDEILANEKAYLKLDDVVEFSEVKALAASVKSGATPVAAAVASGGVILDSATDTESGGMFGGLRRVFGRDKDKPNEPDIPEADGNVSNPLVQEQTSLEEVDSKPVNFSERRARTGLIAGLGFGAIALLGTAYALTQMNSRQTEKPIVTQTAVNLDTPATDSDADVETISQDDLPADVLNESDDIVTVDAEIQIAAVENIPEAQTDLSKIGQKDEETDNFATDQAIDDQTQTANVGEPLEGAVVRDSDETVDDPEEVAVALQDSVPESFEEIQTIPPITYRPVNVLFSPLPAGPSINSDEQYTRLASLDRSRFDSPLIVSDGFEDPFQIDIKQSGIDDAITSEDEPVNIDSTTESRNGLNTQERNESDQTDSPRIQIAERTRPADNITIRNSQTTPETPQTDTPPRQAVQPEITPQTRSVTSDYAPVIREVQIGLTRLGFYNGEIDGENTQAFQDASRAYKQIYDLPVTNNLTGEFLTSVRRNVEAREAIDVVAVQAVDEAAPQQVAELQNPTVTLFETPVVTEPSANDAGLNTLTPEPVQEAALEITQEPTPAPEQVILPPKLTKSSTPEYPQAAIRRNIYVNATVEIEYDIDAEGEVQNARLKSIDYDGRMQSRFVDAAIKATERQQFDPQTIDGVPVEAKGAIRRVVFRGE